MKIFANNKIWKKIVLIFVTITCINFAVPKSVEANDFEFGGQLMKPVIKLVVGVGDAAISVMHRVLLKQTEARIVVSTDKTNWFIKIISIVAVVIFVAAAVVLVGYALPAVLGAALSAKALGTVIVIALAAGSYSAVQFADKRGWDDECVLPLYNLSPEEIFKGKIALFDVDFFSDENDFNKRYEYTVISENSIEIGKDAKYEYDYELDDAEYQEKEGILKFHLSLVKETMGADSGFIKKAILSVTFIDSEENETNSFIDDDGVTVNMPREFDYEERK